MDSRISRRECLTRGLALAGGAMIAAVPARAAFAGAAATRPQPGRERRINGVLGPIAPDRLGLTLMHEHVLVDFIGANRVSASRYDADEVFARVLPYLQQLRTRGGATLLECTPAYLGRDPRLLRRLAEASGLNILTNTGYYGANQDKHLPPHAFTETAPQLAGRWVREWEHGIDDTGIKPAFIKIGVDPGPLSTVDAKLVRAAILTHEATGLPIAAHGGSGVAAFEELDLVERLGMPPHAFIWVHAHAEKDGSLHVRAAKRGAWVEFDGLSDRSVDTHVTLVSRMKGAGLLDHVLVSHDAGWYHVGEPEGGEFRPFDTLFTKFVPALKAAGWSDAELRRLLVDNPRRALTGAASA